MKGCCCENLGFDGTCISKAGKVIAKCLSFNATIAKCIESGSESVSDVEDITIECIVYSSCTRVEQENENNGITGDTSSNIIPFYVPICVGLVLWIFYFYAIKKHKGHQQRRQANRRDTEVGIMELGTYLVILGFAQQFYQTSFLVCLVLLILPILARLFQMRDFIARFSEDEKGSFEDCEKTGIQPEDVEIDLESPPAMTAVDIYEDLSTNMVRVVTTFLCQSILISLYAYLIFEEGSPDFSKLKTIGYYLLGAIVQITYNKVNQMVATEERKKPFLYYWVVLTSRIRKKNCLLFVQLQGEAEYEIGHLDVIMKDQSPGAKKIVIPGSIEIYTRISFSFFINILGRNIITLLLPLHLAQSESTMDFILNAIAAYFIIDIDDLKDTVTFFILSEIFQHQYALEHPEYNNGNSVHQIAGTNDNVEGGENEEDGANAKDIIDEESVVGEVGNTTNDKKVPSEIEKLVIKSF